MTTARQPDWDRIDLVVFDVDGTLYDQRRLRLRMMLALLKHVAATRNPEVLRVLRHFREVREALGQQDGADFLTEQYRRTAAHCGRSASQVEAIVSDWMERRPLPHLAACRYDGVAELFRATTQAGKTVGIFSDYAAVRKIAALGLKADFIVAADDPDVRRLKPHPAGLSKLVDSAGTLPERTLMIGDRFDRDFEVARRAGTGALIRSRRPHPEVGTFRSYRDPVFRPLLSGHSRPPAHRTAAASDGPPAPEIAAVRPAPGEP